MMRLTNFRMSFLHKISRFVLCIVTKNLFGSSKAQNVFFRNQKEAFLFWNPLTETGKKGMIRTNIPF